jgi:hypothetical protein
MKCSCRQEKEIHSMIRTQVVNCTPIVDCSQDDGKSVAETASDYIVMGEVQELYEFPLLISQRIHSDLSLAPLDNALQQLYNNQSAFRDQKMSNPAMHRVDEPLGGESHQL